MAACWIHCTSRDLRERWSTLFRAGLPDDDEPPSYHERWLLVVAGADAVACSAHLVDDGFGVYLSAACVAEGFRGRGLQKRAVRFRERWGRLKGAKRAVTYTSPHNVPSMRTLVRCGYAPYSPGRAWVGRTGWVYWCRDIATDARPVPGARA